MRKTIAPLQPRPDYRRVDLVSMGGGNANPLDDVSPAAKAPGTGVRWGVLPLSATLCLAQSLAGFLLGFLRNITLTGTLIPVLGFILTFAIVLAVNPLLRFTQLVLGRWAGPLNRGELVCLFTAMLVTAGISTSGLVDPLVPMLATPNNPVWNTSARGWNESLVPRLNPKLYIQDPQAIKAFQNGVAFTDSHGRHLTAPRDSAPWVEKLAYGFKVFKAIPWMIWITPLAYWMIFIVGCYGIFYSLTYVVLSYWSDREKLIFPHVRLYEAILPTHGAGRYRIPVILLTPGFWCGFTFSFLLLAWNANVSDGLLRGTGLAPIPLGMGAGATVPALAGSIFQGLAPNVWAAFMMLVIFTAIGIAFLLPLEISFSVWFYYLLGCLIMLMHIWSGRGANVHAFPSDNIWNSNPITSLGGGGIFFFSAMCLFRCVRDYFRLIAGKSLGRRFVIALPVLGLMACITVVVLWLNWNRLPLGWAIAFVGCFTLLTLGLMRIVAEAGMYFFEVNTGFFHLYKMLGLGKLLAPAIVAPLAPIYYIFFFSYRTFLAPNLLNAADMRKGSHVSQAKFHLNLVICIALSVVVSLGACIFVCHLRGANTTGNWYYSVIPASVIMDGAQRTISTLPSFDLTHTLWFVGGVLWVALSVFLRTRFFWFPHPIGAIMLVSPTINSLWFSFFVGWLCKRLAVRYGGKPTFERLRTIFIGLIAGELAAVFFWSLIALIAGMDIGSVTLNRWLS